VTPSISDYLSLLLSITTVDAIEFFHRSPPSFKMLGYRFSYGNRSSLKRFDAAQVANRKREDSFISLFWTIDLKSSPTYILFLPLYDLYWTNLYTFFSFAAQT
jgi:hypothetical protein